MISPTILLSKKAIGSFISLQRKSEIIYTSLLKKAGDDVGMEGTTATQLLGAYAVMKDMDDFKQLLADVYENVKFFNNKGENLVIKI